MHFSAFSNANVRFTNQKLTWRSYTATKTFIITKRVEIIDKNKFAMAAFNKDSENFVIQVAALKPPKMMIYSLKAAQIIDNNYVQVATLQ